MLYEVWKIANSWYECNEQVHIKNKEVAIDAFISGYDEGFRHGVKSEREKGDGASGNNEDG